MRIGSARDLGLYVRDRRRQLGMTQIALSELAGVSRRWLSDLEAGKPTAEIGLVLNTLHALDLIVDLAASESVPQDIDLDQVLRNLKADRDADE